MNDVLGFLLVLAVLSLGAAIHEVAVFTREWKDGLKVSGGIRVRHIHTIKEPREPWQGGGD